jgi:hypothetical protein
MPQVTRYTASISLSKIKKLIQANHKSLYTNKNGDTYLSIDVLVGEEKVWDDGNKSTGSIVASTTVAERAALTKEEVSAMFSLGSLRVPEYKVDQDALGPMPAAVVKNEDLPF